MAYRGRSPIAFDSALAAAGFDATGVATSPITGPEGNVEYLVGAVYRNDLDS